MLTAIIPIQIKKNPFWSSPRGIECIDDFLEFCSKLSEVRQIIVITRDEVVKDLAKKYNVEINNTLIIDSKNRPYTFEQTLDLARYFEKYCSKKTDGLLILDHRNLLLTSDDIKEASILYQQNLANGVIGLSFCWDYPCQYKSFNCFLDCVIFNFNKTGIHDGPQDTVQGNFSENIICNIKRYGDLTINISVKSSRSSITFYSKNSNLKDYVAQIVPFDTNGTQYLQCQEIYVPTSEYEKIIEVDVKKLKGIVMVLTMPSKSGEYDTIEVFKPTNAPWELSGAGTSVRNSNSKENMFGRQQFPAMYSYDGSVCILGRKDNMKKEVSTPKPFILQNSSIVTDWVDYYYTI